MGSIRVLLKDKRIRFKTIAEAEFLDEDYVPVFVSLDVDVNGDICELDVFKADFSALKTWPSADDLNIKKL